MVRQSSGFTLTELVTVIVILGILAVVALPRMSTSEYRALEFRDKTVAALRYAQKTATSHRRLVCVDFDVAASKVTVTIAQANPGPCVAALNLPGSNSNVVESGDKTNAVITATTPADPDFNFLPDGSGIDVSITISGQTPITVVGTTGHVQ